MHVFGKFTNADYIYFLYIVIKEIFLKSDAYLVPESNFTEQMFFNIIYFFYRTSAFDTKLFNPSTLNITQSGSLFKI